MKITPSVLPKGTANPLKMCIRDSTKPDPTGLFALMTELGADPAATLFVGDSDVDILTGHNAQLPAMGALWGFRGRAELTAAGADALAEVPEDILRYVQEQNR